MPDEMARRRDLRALVDEIIEKLSEHHRRVFVLRERDGKTYQEIAELTGLELGTVKYPLNRARSRFADLIADHVDEAVPA